MSSYCDDSQQVLSILNSLGYIGITAEQLKAFMKDLKLYRKLKERERQQWKIETTKKFFYNQQKALLELFRECSNDQLISSKSNSSPIKVKVKYRPNYRDEGFYDEVIPRTITPTILRNRSSATTTTTTTTTSTATTSRKSEISSFKVEEKRKTDQLRPPSFRNDKEKANDNENANSCDIKSVPVVEVSKTSQESNKKQSIQTTEQNKQMKNPSKNSLKTQSKTFIRPWRLHSASQRLIQKKSDPVMLYQQYQKEWKRISFPGENRHNDVRWSIREKMLGTDPNPKPVVPKTNSFASMRKR